MWDLVDGLTIGRSDKLDRLLKFKLDLVPQTACQATAGEMVTMLTLQA